ncbi:MAG TPA: polysaccharide deacetylase family protein, partial [Polyangiaceae bacterium]|nr:polysaccharide deacetylase family protein [Polyangiaceae bacterium]
MLRLTSRTALSLALLFGALACSDDSDDPTPALGGTGGAVGGSSGASGSSGSAGTGAGTGGSAGSAGAANGGSAGSAGSAGASGAAGAAGAAGAGGSAGDAGAGADGGFPVPDKLVALTFDDGPSATLTPPVLDKLEAHGVPASFFLIGQNINAGAQAVLDRAASLGCTFENHSNGFASLNNTDAQTISTSVDTTTQLIEQFTDQSPVFFRPPNLAVDQNLLDTVDLAIASGLLGNDFPGTLNGGDPTVQFVADNIINGVQDGTIILLHDVQPSLNPQVTPDALDIIIPTLKSQGYEFV